MAAAIKACEKEPRWEIALALFAEMPAGVDADVVSYNAVISACEKN